MPNEVGVAGEVRTELVRESQFPMGTVRSPLSISRAWSGGLRSRRMNEEMNTRMCE